MKVNKWLILILGLTMVGFVGFSSFQKASEETPAAHYYDEWMQADDRKRANILKQNSKQSFTNISSAAIQVSYAVKMPKNSMGRKLLGVYLAEAPEGLDGQITILYEKGLYIKQIPVDGTISDYKEIVNQDIANKEKGILKSDTVPVLLEINGNSGYGIEPGYNGFGDTKAPRPGFVEWRENSVIYIVFGDEIPLNELIKIAESMENIQSFPENKEKKVLKLRSGRDAVTYNREGIIEKDINEIENIDLSQYDTIIVKNAFLNDNDVKIKLQKVVKEGKQVLVVGKGLKETDIVNRLGLENPVKLSLMKEGSIEPKITNDNREERSKNFYSPEEVGTNTFSVVGVELFDLTNNVPHTYLVPEGYSQNEVDSLIEDIIHMPGQERK